MVGIIGVNMPLNPSLNIIADNIVDFLINNLLPRFWEIISAPFQQPETLWIVAPLIIAMVLMQAYFSRYRQEELGWNTAFGNSISLIFVFVNLLQKTYLDYKFGLFFSPKVYFIGLLLFLTLMQLTLNFFHKWPKKFAFFLGSAVFVNTIAYLSIIFIYTNIPLDYISFFAALTLFLVIFALFRIFRHLIPMSYEAKIFVEKKKKEKEEKEHIKELHEETQQKLKEAEFKNALKSAVFFILTAVAVSFTVEIILIFYNVPFILSFVPLLQGAVFIPIIRRIMRKENLAISNLNFDKKKKAPIIGVFLGIVMLGLISFLNRGLLLLGSAEQINLILNANLFYNGVFSNWIFLVIYLTGFVIVVPLTDEFAFRGLILRDLHKRFSVKTAVLIQALFFTIRYFDFYTLSLSYGYIALLRFAIPFICGLAFGIIKEKVNLETSVFAHVTVNLLGAIIFISM